jgi:hypothetical protein
MVGHPVACLGAFFAPMGPWTHQLPAPPSGRHNLLGQAEVIERRQGQGRTAERRVGQVAEAIDQNHIDPCLGEEPGQFPTGRSCPHNQNLAVGFEALWRGVPGGVWGG